MRKIILALAVLALVGCSSNDAPVTTGSDGANTMSPGYSTTVKAEGLDDFDDKPVLDSVVKWMDGNGNLHIDVYAADFPVKGDSGYFMTIVTN